MKTSQQYRLNIKDQTMANLGHPAKNRFWAGFSCLIAASRYRQIAKLTAPNYSLKVYQDNTWNPRHTKPLASLSPPGWTSQASRCAWCPTYFYREHISRCTLPNLGFHQQAFGFHNFDKQPVDSKGREMARDGKIPHHFAMIRTYTT